MSTVARPRNRKAFTLIELLVVISIIALLLSIVLPSLNRAKGLAKNLVCKVRMRTLVTGLIAYAESHKGQLVVSDVDSPGCWWGTNGEPTGDVRTTQTYAERGALWSYVGSRESYNCPADPRMINGTAKDWGKSYSLSSGINSLVYKNYFAPTCTKITDIKSPSQRFTFVECFAEFYVGSWKMPIPPSLGGLQDLGEMWGDPLSIYHYKKNSNFAFADGHAESYMYQDRRTLEIDEERGYGQSWYGYVSPPAMKIYIGYRDITQSEANKSVRRLIRRVIKYFCVCEVCAV